MANHLTPEKLSKELGIDRQEVIRVCVEEGVPIFRGPSQAAHFQAEHQTNMVERHLGNQTLKTAASFSASAALAEIFINGQDALTRPA